MNTQTMRAFRAMKVGGPFVCTEIAVPEPARGQVRVRVHACGVCGGDAIARNGLLGVTLPRVPGHEIGGVIDAVGEGVVVWKVGQRVGVGWQGGYCTTCDFCRAGDFVNCANAQVVGLSYDGGYAEYVVVPQLALARIPDALSFEEAGPLMCAGITTFNALRNCGAGPGDLVAIHGVGGLGHLGIQFAARQGFHTVAVNRGRDKETLARSLGAQEYIDSEAADPAAALQAMGGAKAIIATVTSAAAMQAISGGLGANGTMMVIGAVGALTVNSLDLLGKRAAVKGWYSGTAVDSEDTLQFSILNGIASMNEVFPLEQAQAAYDRMMSGKARFRVVLKVDQ
jgi:alcohol dehydrogenase